MSERMRPKKKSKMKPLLPVFGFIILGISGAIAWFLSLPLLGVLQDYIPDIPTDAESEGSLQVVMAVMIFLIIIIIVAMIYAILFSSKPEFKVTEQEMDRERREKQKEVLKHKKRARQVRRKEAQERRRRGEQIAD